MGNDTRSALDFYREVRLFSLRSKPWTVALWHEVLPDEEYDTTLIAERVYGRRDEHLAVMAAVGLDTVEAPLKVGFRFALPTEEQLYQIKRRTGFESNPDWREDGQPVWL